MKRRSKRSCRNLRRAITLIEIVIGIGLLSVLLVSVVTVSSRVSRQIKVTQIRLQAVHALDELLNALEIKALDVNGRANGNVASNPELSWFVEPVPNSEDRLLGTRLVRVRMKHLRVSEEIALASVELVVPDDHLLEMAPDGR